MIAVFVQSISAQDSITNSQDDMTLLTPTEQDFSELAELMRFLRSERKESLFVPVAKLQLDYITRTADSLENTDPERAKELRIFARGICFNIASFTWPGWGDWPEPVPEHHQQLGLEAAKKGVELAELVGEVTSNILWIQGAHEMNAWDYESAVSSFSKSKSFAKDDFHRTVQQAWVLLAQLLASGEPAISHEFQELLVDIKKSEHDDADFHVEQIRTALSVYQKSED